MEHTFISAMCPKIVEYNSMTCLWIKNAIVQPLLKKPLLDPKTLRNYKPISKILKSWKKAGSWSADCFYERKLMFSEKFQSGFRALHWAKTVPTESDELINISCWCGGLLHFS